MKTVERLNKRMVFRIDLLEIGCALDKEVGCSKLPAKPFHSFVLFGVTFEKSPDSGCEVKRKNTIDEVQLGELLVLHEFLERDFGEHLSQELEPLGAISEGPERRIDLAKSAILLDKLGKSGILIEIQSAAKNSVLIEREDVEIADSRIFKNTLGDRPAEL